jgi:hypothetical protein
MHSRRAFPAGRGALLVAAFLFVSAPAAPLAQIAQAETPRSAPAASPSVTDEKVLAREFLRRLLKRDAPRLKAGDRVVLVGDGSLDPALIELVRETVWESKANLDVLLLQGVGKMTDSARLQIDLWCIDPRAMWPEWVWKSLEGSAAVISAYGPDVHNMTPADRQWFPDHGIARVRFWHATIGTLLVDAQEQGIGYPEEILAALRAASKKQIEGGKRVRVTDPNGTDFTFSFLDRSQGRIYADANGKVVAYAMHGGLIPKTTLHLENGSVVKVEGAGDLANQVRSVMESMKDLTWPHAPRAGGVFLVEADLDRITPKIARPAWQGMYGAAKYFAFSKGYKRAGVLTIGFGTPTAAYGPDVAEFARAHNATIQHLDTHLYHATVTVDGRVLIKDGRPTALDDPEVRKVAAKFGNPDELLRIDWVPALDGK